MLGSNATIAFNTQFQQLIIHNTKLVPSNAAHNFGTVNVWSGQEDYRQESQQAIERCSKKWDRTRRRGGRRLLQEKKKSTQC